MKKSKEAPSGLTDILQKIPGAKSCVIALVDAEGMLHMNNFGDHHAVIGLASILQNGLQARFQMHVVNSALKQQEAANG